MNIIIPVDGKDIEESQISKLDDAKAWILMEFEDGKFIKEEFYDKKEDIADWIDIAIVSSDKEYVWPFMEEGITVLVAPMQKYIEDIQEAFLFKELHDLNI
jgi:hypothetical protein